MTLRPNRSFRRQKYIYRGRSADYGPYTQQEFTLARRELRSQTAPKSIIGQCQNIAYCFHTACISFRYDSESFSKLYHACVEMYSPTLLTLFCNICVPMENVYCYYVTIIMVNKDLQMSDMVRGYTLTLHRLDVSSCQDSMHHRTAEYPCLWACSINSLPSVGLTTNVQTGVQNLTFWTTTNTIRRCCSV